MPRGRNGYKDAGVGNVEIGAGYLANGGNPERLYADFPLYRNKLPNRRLGLHDRVVRQGPSIAKSLSKTSARSLPQRLIAGV